MMNTQNEKLTDEPTKGSILFASTIGIYLFYIITSRLLNFLIPNYPVNSVIHIFLVLGISFGIIKLASRYGFRLNYSLGNLRGLARVLPMLVIGLWYFLLKSVPQIFNQFDEWRRMGAGKNMADVLYGFSAGIWEETFLRGFLLAGLLLLFSRGKNAGIKAVVYSALTFGAMHITNLMNPGSTMTGVFQQMIYAAIFGILFGVVYLNTHSLLYGVLIHSVYDFSSFMMAPAGALAGDSFIQWGPFILVFGTMLVVSLIYLFALRKHNEQLIEVIKK
ncbi:CPBP family intramembrane glutamic endopeptidase [Lentilactobacillus sp. Marseille-Q4993]|uniref:CPBP family intramembrane glutamic endopeptidase n=1 Tax=Lentilactobacillus sp. Marseille-Q4993 TaxID=3039492 RepID=UPI0024BC1D72|nr:CPBP family intramembrane glutamic endopeptidase [Lentilactobacillus sp. Marseille-Q4993]